MVNIIKIKILMIDNIHIGYIIISNEIHKKSLKAFP